MVDNWFKLIGSFNISLPNVFFSLAIILGVVAFRLSNELPQNAVTKFLAQLEEKSLEILNVFLEKLKSLTQRASQAKRSNIQESGSQAEPPKQKLYSIKPVDLSPSNQSIKLLEDDMETISAVSGSVAGDNKETCRQEIIEIKPISNIKSAAPQSINKNPKARRWEDFEEIFQEPRSQYNLKEFSEANKNTSTNPLTFPATETEANGIITYRVEDIPFPSTKTESKAVQTSFPNSSISRLSISDKAENLVNNLITQAEEKKNQATPKGLTEEPKETPGNKNEKKSVKVNILKEAPTSLFDNSLNNSKPKYLPISSEDNSVSIEEIIEEPILENRNIYSSPEGDKAENYLPDELFREGQDGLTFYPLIEIKGSSIQRFKQIEFLKNSYRGEDLLFLIGPASSGKSYLASLYAREVKFTENCSVLSFSFSQNVNLLAEGIRLIMVEQLGTTSKFNENTVVEFFGTIASKPHLLILNNVDFLSKEELLSLETYASPHCRILLISNTLSARSICQINLNWKNNIYEIPQIESELVQNYFLERIPTAFKSSPALVNRLIRLVRGNPLALNLFCSLHEFQLKRNRESSIEDLFKLIDSHRVVNDGKIPISLCKLLSLLFPRLAPIQRDILLYCSYFPIDSFSSSLIEAVFELSETECLQTLEALSQAGLIQRVSGQPFQEPCFAVHSTIKDFIYSQQRLEEFRYVELINRTASYFLGIMQEESRLKRENIIFAISGISYCLKLIKGDFSEKPHLLPLFEKALDFFYAVGLIKKIEKEILFIYKDNLEQSSSQSIKVFWNKLVGLAYLMIAKENPDPVLRSKGIQDGIDLLNASLHLLPSNFNPYQVQKIHNDLGNAYLSLSESEANEAHLIKAVEHLKKAIQIDVSDKQQLKQSTSFILAHINLGNVYMKLYQLKPSALTLHLSSQILIKCLKNFSKDLPLDALSTVNQNVANALRMLAGHEEPIANLESAVEFYKEALLGADLQNKALILNSIGCCFWKLTKYKDPVRNIQLAISFYRKSMGVVIDESGKIVEIFDPIECAVTLNNLGISYKTLASMQDPETNYPLALKAFREALRIVEERQDQNLAGIINKHISELYYALDILMNQKGPNARFIDGFTGQRKASS
ncbi:MAG: tetratricopeptide repeat protein [Candidatus Caenarcaniphilales bacterium]|nr:tetratricopeptide repeat protein [Candidatus Caenarcaniphilales bacterium]